MKVFIPRATLLAPAFSLLLVFGSKSFAEDGSALRVTLEAPAASMKMGETPSFSGVVANTGRITLDGLLIYLSLVSLNPGAEEPVDLEDWSVKKAIRIDRLLPGEKNTQQWNMRLIQAGKYGAALTVIDPKQRHPVISPLVRFDVQPKSLFASKDILSIAIGEPVLLLLIWGMSNFFARGIKLMRRAPAE